MTQVFRWMMVLMLATAMNGCPDDDDDATAGAAGEGGDGDHTAAEHDHTSCGLQANCKADAPELSSMPRVEGEHFTMMVHDPTDYSTNEETGWVEAMMMLHFTSPDGETLANTDVTVYTYSEDCMHKGPTPDFEGTTNEAGMVMFMATFTHGGPWSIVAEMTDGDMTHMTGLELCVPGSDHEGNAADHSMHMM